MNETRWVFTIHLLLVRDRHGWLAQGMEFDVAAQGDSMAEAQHNFMRTFADKLLLDASLGRQPMADVRPAPPELWARFWTSDLPLKDPLLLFESVPVHAVATDVRAVLGE